MHSLAKSQNRPFFKNALVLISSSFHQRNLNSQLIKMTKVNHLFKEKAQFLYSWVKQDFFPLFLNKMSMDSSPSV